ncbi:neutral zinc metallopeptidase [Rhodoplanes sp. TEM]|uniref:Neutral zinc metallopeptidase n=1 Tax=Rhodoplanes tepidamans TaxID=200616 RepID=A0ABT5JJE7_RHOTP|nr:MULTISPECIES: neutral zinc metallopeptidase [Rhodoplanes]MDC7789498.1 neutral zinc metallopeptidase [Rhodoplanes tepidamans]MDC7986128.1 neutral zinc metallopeptidase [Rhodoplanes sp. TEM]MDQ0358915.1 putative metalloprotease [Rhodoplanes tepidamans]
MRWDNLPESENVEDRRGDDGGGRGGFGMPMGMGGGGGLGIGTIVVLGLIGWALGIDPRILIGGAEMVGGSSHREAPAQSSQRQTGSPDDQMGKFVSRVLGSTEVQWREVFSKSGKTYRAPVLVLYNEVTNQPCGGVAQASMGPFYCPADKKIYLDTSFFREIERRFKGCDVGSKSCQFAQAYVIAHEVGHHVQNLLGILPKVQEMQRGMSKVEANKLQVRVELQADCFAGVWAHFSDQKWNLIEPGDVEAAMRTAAAIGDDKLQMQARGRVVPDSFTHGSSAQRQRWFETGLKQGSVAACNTFQAQSL